MSILGCVNSKFFQIRMYFNFEYEKINTVLSLTELTACRYAGIRNVVFAEGNKFCQFMSVPHLGSTL